MDAILFSEKYYYEKLGELLENHKKEKEKEKGEKGEKVEKDEKEEREKEKEAREAREEILKKEEKEEKEKFKKMDFDINSFLTYLCGDIVMYNKIKETIFELDFMINPSTSMITNDTDYILEKIINFYSNSRVSYLPHFLIERACSKIFHQVILVSCEMRGTFVFFPNGTYQSFFSLLSNNLCSIIEEEIPLMFVVKKKDNVNQYQKLSIEEYIEKRRCEICKDDNNHKTHIFLPCCHTFCNKCTQKIKETSLNCPFCKSTFRYIDLIDSQDPTYFCTKNMKTKIKRSDKFF